MATIKDYLRYVELMDEAEDYKYRLERHLETRFDEYKDYGIGSETIGHYFPDDVTDITVTPDCVNISGHRYACGCTDHVYCSIPYVMAFGDDEERSEWITNRLARLNQELANTIREKEDRERKMYLELKEKYGD